MRSLTVTELNSQLRLAERGESDGGRELPSSEASQISDTETLVVTRIRSALTEQSRTLLGGGAAGDFSALPQELDALASEPQIILTQFRGRKARAQSAAQIELGNAHTDFERVQHAYRLFRRQHDLTHTEPVYDTIFWRKVFWLTLLFSIEVAANGWVIGQASPGGLIQGWTTALMISILVVLTGTLIGIGPWRYLSYAGVDGRGRFHLIWAVPAVVLGLSALTFFALYVAHYRAALATTALDAPVPDNILTSITRNPFGPFEQLDSVVLFVIAMLIGVFSIARGVRWDDPYPGYGGLHRKVMAERERTQQIARDLAAEVDDAKQAATAALIDVNTRAQQAMGALKQALARTRENGAEWDRSAAATIAVGREAVAIYRTANRAKRTTPAPRYFSDDPFAATAPAASAATIASLEEAVSTATANNTQFKSQLAGANAQLETEYKAFYADELSPFLKGISDGAVVKAREDFDDRASVVQLVNPERSEEADVRRSQQTGAG